jgi:hypothetical protein
MHVIHFEPSYTDATFCHFELGQIVATFASFFSYSHDQEHVLATSIC